MFFVFNKGCKLFISNHFFVVDVWNFTNDWSQNSILHIKQRDKTKLDNYSLIYLWHAKIVISL